MCCSIPASYFWQEWCVLECGHFKLSCLMHLISNPICRDNNWWRGSLWDVFIKKKKKKKEREKKTISSCNNRIIKNTPRVCVPTVFQREAPQIKYFHDKEVIQLAKLISKRQGKCVAGMTGNRLETRGNYSRQNNCSSRRTNHVDTPPEDQNALIWTLNFHKLWKLRDF